MQFKHKNFATEITLRAKFTSFPKVMKLYIKGNNCLIALKLVWLGIFLQKKDNGFFVNGRSYRCFGIA